MNSLRKYIREILKESITLDVEVGDVILTGRFKNKRQVVKSIGKDEYGHPTVNGRSILKFKIEKQLPKKKWSAKSREELNESRFKQMSKEEITGLRSYLQNANFMNVDAGGDYEANDTFVSEAQQTLIEELSDYFGEAFPPYGTINVQVRVDLMATNPDEGADKVLKGASYFWDDVGHNIDLIIAQMDDGETLSQLGNVAKKVYEVVSHELLHMHQFIKFSKGEPDKAKWEEFKSSYEEGDVANQDQDYFFFDPEDGPSELETFAFQIGNELFSDLGKEAALQLLPSKRAKNVPDLESLKKSSASIRQMTKRNVGFDRPEFLDMLKRSRQYISRM